MCIRDRYKCLESFLFTTQIQRKRNLGKSPKNTRLIFSQLYASGTCTFQVFTLFSRLFLRVAVCPASCQQSTLVVTPFSKVFIYNLFTFFILSFIFYPYLCSKTAKWYALIRELFPPGIIVKDWRIRNDYKATFIRFSFTKRRGFFPNPACCSRKKYTSL